MNSTLWYFAYGSNLDASTFVGRRRMQPLATTVGVLNDFELRFDLPVGPGERGVANVAPRPGDQVWGALYRLTPVDADRLDRTEGVDKGAYRRLAVTVHAKSGALVSAFTYRVARADARNPTRNRRSRRNSSRHATILGSSRSEISHPERKPSRRYLRLLLSGARDLGLPAEWVERLRAWPLAVDERDQQLPLR